MNQAHLFGEPLTQEPTPQLEASGKKKRKPTRPNGYAAQPGTGPEGETCGTCKHHCQIRYSRTYHKCGLIRHLWTGGPGSDILVRSPACRSWEAADGQNITAVK
jgi:hypothetical protein